jgi:HAD superfamily hydrolase (TIGR01484 family)
MLIATDLDGTFLGGSADARRELYRLITASPDIRLAYVTGRAYPLVRPLFEDPEIPRPEFAICDVGATVLDGSGERMEPLQSEIEARWPGEAAVVAALAEVAPTLLRQDQPQARRVSYYCDEGQVTPQIEDAVRALGCELLYSAGRFLDVLPRGVDKGSTLRALVQQLDIEPAEVLVAGDTLNDLAMYAHGFNGVCVGESEPGLLNATTGRPKVFHASAPGCGGILQALRHFGLPRT